MLKFSSVLPVFLCLLIAFLIHTPQPLSSIFQGYQVYQWPIHLVRYLYPSLFASVTPHSASWESWWPSRPFASRHFHGLRQWNLLYHLGGYSPWIEMIDGVSNDQEHENGGTGPPSGCVVDSVHMVDLSHSFNPIQPS